MPSQKELKASEWQLSSEGRQYRHLDIGGVQYLQWVDSKGPVVRVDSRIPQNLSNNLTNHGFYPPEGHEPAYSRFPKEDFPSTRADDRYDEPDKPLSNTPNGVMPNRNPQADSQPRDLAGARELGQITKTDQPAYPLGTKKIRRKADRTYCLDQDDKVIGIVYTSRHELRPDQRQSDVNDLTDRFANSMSTPSRTLGGSDSHQASRHATDPQAQLQGAVGDPRSVSTRPLITDSQSRLSPSEIIRKLQQDPARVEAAYNRRQPVQPVTSSSEQRNSSDEKGSSDNSDHDLGDRRTKHKREGTAVRHPSVPGSRSNITSDEPDFKSGRYSSGDSPLYSIYTLSSSSRHQATAPVQDPRFPSQSRDFAVNGTPSTPRHPETSLVSQTAAMNLQVHLQDRHSIVPEPPYGMPGNRATLTRANTEPPSRHDIRHSTEVGNPYPSPRTATGPQARGPLLPAKEALPNARKAHSDGAETDETAIGISDKQQTRLKDVRCKGRHKRWEKTNAYLDSGASDNVISKWLFDKLKIIGAATLDVDNGSVIGSATGDAMEVLGQTTISIWWFDFQGARKDIRKRFQVIRGLYPHMIFKEDTILEFKMRADADPWPRDPRKGLLMFNRPWKSSENRSQDDDDQKKKKEANREKAEREQKDREKKRENDKKRDGTGGDSKHG